MISQQAVCIGFGDRLYKVGVQLEKVMVIAFFDEDVLPIVASVVDMIVKTGFEGDDFIFLYSHGFAFVDGLTHHLTTSGK